MSRHVSRFSLLRPLLAALLMSLLLPLLPAGVAHAQDDEEARPATRMTTTRMMSPRELLEAGGYIGGIILVLSVGMVALIVEHLISIRRGALMPDGLAEQVHQLMQQGQFKAAEQLCRERPSFLGRVLGAGLAEVSVGPSEIDTAMENAAAEQAARLFRKIE